MSGAFTMALPICNLWSPPIRIVLIIHLRDVHDAKQNDQRCQENL